MPAPREPSIHTLAPDVLRRAREGDRTGFAQLVELYYPRALRFARAMLGDPRDAEEAVQDTFVRVFDNLGRFRGDEAFDPWFFRILGNRCRTLAGKRKRHHALIDYTPILPETVSDSNITVPDEAFVRRVYAALADLPAEQREAFLLRHVNDLDYDEMTTVTGARGSTLRMRVKRAVDALRVRLSDGGARE